jgi:hypothetical protein
MSEALDDENVLAAAVEQFPVYLGHDVDASIGDGASQLDLTGLEAGYPTFFRIERIHPMDCPQVHPVFTKYQQVAAVSRLRDRLPDKEKAPTGVLFPTKAG